MNLDANLISFTMLALGLTLVPGADTALVTKNAIARGRRAGYLTVFGVCLGCLVHAIASALGLSVILKESAEVFEAVKLIGAGYLVWIGVQSIRAAYATSSQNVAADDRRSLGAAVPAGVSRPFVEGLLTNILNPKVALFYLMVLPLFIAPDQPVIWRSLLLAGIHILLGLGWMAVYLSFLDVLKHWFARPHVRRNIESTLGGLLVLLGVRLALERRMGN